MVGCEDGTARLFDMYSRKCSRIIRYGVEKFINWNIVLFPFYEKMLMVKSTIVLRRGIHNLGLKFG